MSPDNRFQEFGSPTNVGIASMFIGGVIVNQQVQSDQSWPMRFLPAVAEEAASETDDEPNYESPLERWLNLDRT